MSFSYAGKIVLVTGGTRGIGRAVAEAFLAHGASVTVCGRTPPATLPESVQFYACDVRDAAEVRAMIDQVAAPAGRLDVLVNNAGGSPAADAATASPRFAERVVALNLLAPYYAAQAAHRWMGHGGSVINICSVSGTRPSPGTAAYGAAKAGLLNLTETLAQEWGPAIRVNAIVAGLIETDDAAAVYGGPASQAAIGDSVPLRRLGRPDDVAHACLYLASPLAAYISGAQLAVHGGGERPHFLDLIKRFGESP